MHRSLHTLSLAPWFRSGTATRRGIASSQRFHPAQQAVSGVIQSSAQMKLSPSVFPVDAAEKVSSSMTAADADQSPMSAIHRVSYRDLGMLGGWLQYYNKRLDTGYSDVIYLGSYYRDSDAAWAAFTDVASNMIVAGPTSVCSLGDQCMEAKVMVTWPDGLYQGIFRVVQKSNAICELLVDVPQTSYSTLQDQVRAYADGVTNGFLGIFAPPQPTMTLLPPATPTSTPTPSPTSTPRPTPTATSVPVDFSIISARLEKNRAKPDVNLSSPALKRAKIGTKVYLSVYVVVRSAPSGSTMTFQYDVTAGGQAVMHRVVSRTLSSVPSQPFREFTVLKLTHTGRQTFTAKVTLNGQSEVKGTSINVVR